MASLQGALVHFLVSTLLLADGCCGSSCLWRARRAVTMAHTVPCPGTDVFSSLGMLVGTVTKSTEAASVVGNIITFPMMFLSGTFFPIASCLISAKLRSCSPLFYIIDGLNAVMIYSNYGQAAIDLVVVTIITIIVFVAAAKLFKWRED